MLNKALFEPFIVGKSIMGLHTLIVHCVKMSCEPFKRVQLMENMILSGGVSEHKELKPMLEQHILNIAYSDTANEYQFKEVKFQTTPEYMTLYKKRPSELCFLGGAIVGKVLYF
jgi:actin-related protein